MIGAAPLVGVNAGSAMRAADGRRQNAQVRVGHGVRAADGRAVDVEARVPLVRRRRLDEIRRRRVRGSQRVVDRHGRRMVVARCVGRVEHRHRGHGRIGRQVDAELRARRGLRRRIGRREPQVGQRAGVERAVAGDREDLQPLLLRVDDEAVAVDAERAGARVRRDAAIVHREETFAADGEIEAAIREVDAALRELLRDRRHRHTVADVLRADGEHVGELGARRLEARGVRVGDVVGRDREVRRRGIQAAQSYCKWHGSIL